MSPRLTAADRERCSAMAPVFAALADPLRLNLLRLLEHGPQHVNALAQSLNARQPTVSKQLAVLAAAGLVVRERRGALVEYRVDDPFVGELCRLACDKLRRDAEAKARALR